MKIEEDKRKGKRCLRCGVLKREAFIGMCSLPHTFYNKHYYGRKHKRR